MKFIPIGLFILLLFIPAHKSFVPEVKSNMVAPLLKKNDFIKSYNKPLIFDSHKEILSLAKGNLQPKVIEPAYTPQSSIQFASNDIATIPPELRKYMRYLSLYNLPREHRRRLAQTLSFMINSLSRRKTIYIPLFVGGSDETVIRINIKDYDWDLRVFDKLLEKGSGIRPSPEPYFYALINAKEVAVVDKVKKKVVKKVPVKKTVPTNSFDQFGNQIFQIVETFEEKTEEVEEEVKTVKPGGKSIGPASWVNQDQFSLLRRETDSEYPIARADWFFVNVSVPPAYYDFLGLGKKDKDFENLIFTDIKLAEKARSQYKAVVITSTVARNNRTLTRSPTFTDGYYWRSHDSKTSVDDRQYILNFLDEKFDATEDIGTLPNGLQAYFLTDGNGNRLDFADPDIAIDNTAMDRIVRSGRSCIVCHAEGIRPIEDEVRALTKKLKNSDSARLLIKDEDNAYKILDLFGTNLDEKIVLDQNIYARAVAASNGLKTEVNAKQFNDFYNKYYEILLSLEDIAAEVGLSVHDLAKYARLSLDPVILGILKNPTRPVRRDQWERSFHNFMVIISTSK